MRKIRLLCSLASSAMLAACGTTHQPAPIVDRGTATRPAESGRTVVVPPAPRNADQRGYYTVRKGDTLLHIALDFGQNYRDLVQWNNLVNANDIKVDQVLRVAPPEAGAGAPQTASVSAGSGVETRPLGAGPAAVTPAAGAPVSKNGPHGEKRPYSEAAIAELQKPDSAGSTASAAVAATTPTQKPADARPTTSTAAGVTQTAEDDNVSWIWPTDGKVSSGFDDGKKGIDIAGKNGQQVLAASNGKVMYAGSGIRGYGNLVIVKHTSNLLSAYAHNKTILVKEGQIVTKGQKIAEMGNSDSDAVKLHFEIRQQGKPVDPSKFLPAR
ncbi:MAG: peptidoglycan DD-metalloendopeptidase family protein [Herminiimonas sp.]|nr:peptidoglycan DD-metalloendopeptidase family protein [Herminiimonas sp.]